LSKARLDVAGRQGAVGEVAEDARVTTSRSSTIFLSWAAISPSRRAEAEGRERDHSVVSGEGRPPCYKAVDGFANGGVSGHAGTYLSRRIRGRA
jgi:hypothetical protein